MSSDVKNNIDIRKEISKKHPWNSRATGAVKGKTKTVPQNAIML